MPEHKSTERNAVQQWLEALFDPMADLDTISQCTVVEDLNGDGEYKLVVAHLSKLLLRVYKGTTVDTHGGDGTRLTEVPTAMVSVFMDQTEPRTPGLAIASGQSVFIFKNFRPFFKISIAAETANDEEKQLWLSSAKGELNAQQLSTRLTEFAKKSQLKLSQQSSFFVNAKPDKKAELFESFVTFRQNKPNAPLQLTQTAATCLSVLNKSNPDEKSINVLVIGTEDGRILIVECEAFSILASVSCFNCLKSSFISTDRFFFYLFTTSTIYHKKLLQFRYSALDYSTLAIQYTLLLGRH